MEFSEVVNKRRTTRQFTGEPVAWEIIERIIDVPKNPFQEMVKIAFPKQRSMFEQAACIILPIFKRDARILNEEAFGRRFMDFAEIRCVIENIFLAVTNEGLAYTMRIPTGKQPEQILDAVDCPKGFVLPCMIGIGHATDNAEFPAQIYPKSDDCIHRNKF